MAISLGIFSTTFLTCNNSTTPSSRSSISLLTSQSHPPHIAANVRLTRTVTAAVAPKTKTTETDKREPRGITKPRRVSFEMQAIVGVPEIPRTQALKLIWAHIKEHNLQDPEDKKIIICDEKLKNIFAGRDRVGFLEIAGLIGPHFLK